MTPAAAAVPAVEMKATTVSDRRCNRNNPHDRRPSGGLSLVGRVLTYNNASG